MKEISEMPVWSVKDDPVMLEIHDWCIAEFFFDEKDATRHVIGRCLGAGRVSSVIETYDSFERTITTKSRTYKLVGSPVKLGHLSSDTQYTLNQWLNVNCVKMMKDVSDDYRA
jgi:hypothetical protein